jgi:hypothetical protein
VTIFSALVRTLLGSPTSTAPGRQKAPWYFLGLRALDVPPDGGVTIGVGLACYDRALAGKNPSKPAIAIPIASLRSSSSWSVLVIIGSFFQGPASFVFLERRHPLRAVESAWPSS